MLRDLRAWWRVGAALAGLLVLTSAMVVLPAMAEPGVPPDISGISESDQDIDPGETRFYKIDVTGVDEPATATFSGDGLAATIVKYGPEKIRLSITADASASGGLRDLTITNPDGFSDTFVGAILVTGDEPPPAGGDVTGHVFEDLDGNGIEDGADSGLSGVSVTITDSGGGVFPTTTDVNGDFTVADVLTGDADVVFTNPGGHALTTGNDSQSVTVVDGGSVAASDVGYQPIPSGDLTGHVFLDLDGNGVEDGSDTGLAGVAVTIVDAAAGAFGATTDAAGDFTVTGLAVGDADVTFAAPANHTLTTGNDSQTVAVTDGGVATSGDVGYEPPAGVPPVITGIAESDQDIDPGETRFYRVDATDVVDPATATFSGDGLTGEIVRYGTDRIRLSVTATLSASPGPRDLTITNPDGLADTWPAAITVTGTNPPPENGEVTGHVFEDLDGNGIEDGSDGGLAGATVEVTDDLGTEHAAVTDADGDFTIGGVAVGDADVTFVTPGGYTLTTANDAQTVTVTDGGSVATADVGYEPGATAYVEVGAAAGLTMTHTVDPLCDAPIGLGAAWADVDNDGDQDLYTTDQVDANRLYRNDGDTSGDGTPDFTEIAASVGVDNDGVNSFATVFVDVDNDGDQDLFVADSDGNKLFENQFVDTGALDFVDVSAAAGIEDFGRVETATFGDVDNDGHLDFYLAKHMSCQGDNVDRLFHNDGDGTFTDWTTYLCGGATPPCDDVNGLGFAAGMLDYDQDGDVDIYLVNDNITNSWQPNKMWRNDGPDGSGGWIFTEVGDETGTDHSVNGMGLGMGDPNNDGWIDLAFSDAAPGHLLSNSGDGTYADVSISSGVNAATTGDTGWGTAFFDYNNDNWQDLYFANGSIGTPSPLADSMLENAGDGTFFDATDATGLNGVERGRGVALADFNDDGWVDLFIANYDAPPQLMLNRSPENGNTNNWIKVTVEGTTSNRDGIGTELVLDTGAGITREIITSGSNHGGGSQKAAFFGTGAENGGNLTVYWPNGEVENVGLIGADTTLHLVEPAPSATGDVDGHVFEDLDGNGLEDGADTGLSGVTVTVTDVASGVHVTTTDANGDYTVAGVPVGDADVVFSNPGGYALTTANDAQTVTVAEGATASTADVGYEPIPSGDLSGHVFSDVDGNGVEDGAEVGLAGVAVSVTDAAAGTFDTTTDANGDFTVTGLAVGDAVVTYTTPDGFTLTTGNGFQTVAITDGGSSVAADVGYQPPAGTPPDITGISESDQNIDPGETRFYKVSATGVVDGASATFSGDGLTATIVRIGESVVRLEVTADGTASAGPRDLTLTNPDGLSDVWPGAITVNGTTPPPTDGSFSDVAGLVGITSTHTASGCAPPIGVGGAWADVDNDGDLDLYTTDRGGPNHLYRNDGDTNSDGLPDFTDIAVSLGVANAGLESYATVFADIDNDGDQDLFVSDTAGNHLWENQTADTGSLAFTDITGASGLSDLGRIQTATFGDVDNDGILDLYFAKHMNCAGDNLDRLFHGNGDGTFTEWTQYLCDGVVTDCDDVAGLGFAAEMLDYDNDGDIDIYLVNDDIQDENQPNKMWRNDGSDGSGGWVFTEVGAAIGVDLSVNGMGLGVGDYNNDGFLDLAFSDAAPGHLLMNDGDGTYTDVSISSGVDAATTGDIGWGTAFFDYNNDGWQDLLFAVGYIGEDDPLPNSLLAGNGSTFVDASAATNMDQDAKGRGIALADFDEDGWVDVYLANYNTAPLLMHNESADTGNTNSSLTVTVEGTESNRDGLGTVLVLTTTLGTQRQMISSGPSHGGGSQKAAFFGLGAAGSGDLSVEWPNGVTEDLGTVFAGTLHLVEPAS